MKVKLVTEDEDVKVKLGKMWFWLNVSQIAHQLALLGFFAGAKLGQKDEDVQVKLGQKDEDVQVKLAQKDEDVKVKLAKKDEDVQVNLEKTKTWKLR